MMPGIINEVDESIGEGAALADALVGGEMDTKAIDALTRLVFASGLVGVAVGALLTGFTSIWVRSLERFRESQGIALALSAEIRALIERASAREYLDGVTASIARLNDVQHQPVIEDVFWARIRQDYFATFHSLSGKIGLLGPLGADVVLVYVKAKSLFEDIAVSSDLFERYLDGRPVPISAQVLRVWVLRLNSSIRELLLACVEQGKKATSELDAYANQSYCAYLRNRRRAPIMRSR